MKRNLLTLSLIALAASALGQGTVLYYNTGTGLKAPIYGQSSLDSTLSLTGNTSTGAPVGSQVYASMTTLSGATFRAQLFGATGVAAEAQLGAATTVNTFRAGLYAGYLGVATATINAIAPDAASATLQLRTWDNSSGLYPTWAEAEVAWLRGEIAAGKSPLFTQTGGIGGGTLSPALPLGLRSFNIYKMPIPEPSTFVLAGLGAAALLIFRRRK